MFLLYDYNSTPHPFAIDAAAAAIAIAADGLLSFCHLLKAHTAPLPDDGSDALFVMLFYK